MTRVAVVGASGFIGSGVMAVLGADGLAIRAPRTPTPARSLQDLESAARELSSLSDQLSGELVGIDAVVIACGRPDATGQGSDELYGANSLAPLLVLRAAKKAGCSRVVHVSSAVVQGSAPELNSRPASTWFSDYSKSKVLAEQLLTLDVQRPELPIELVVYRPPSVHSADRRITRMLARVAQSPISSVAGRGDAPSPQALHENVCTAIAFLARCSDPPLIVHHPWEGMSTGGLMTMLGDGQVPRRIPTWIARCVELCVRLVCLSNPRLRPHARRLNMLWFGQRQAPSWLEQAGWVRTAGEHRWRELAASHRREPAQRTRRIVLGVTVPMSMNLMRGYPEHLVKEGWDVHFVSSGPTLEIAKGFTHHVIPMHREPNPWHDLVALLRWVRLLRRLRPDVVAVGTPKAGLLGSVAACLVRTPVRVYKLRGLRLETAAGWRRRVYMAMERLAVAATSRVIAVSPSLHARAIELKLAPPTKIQVLGPGSSNGVDLARFDQYLSDRRQDPLSRDVPVVGFVGRIHRDKGILDLLAAAKLLTERKVEFELVLIGGVEDHEMYSAITEAVGRGLPISHWGYVAEPASAYASFDILCLPTYREGFPTVVLEAAASHVPTVTTRATGAIDAVIDGETGILVDVGSPDQLAEALEQLLLDDGLRKVMGRRARERVEREFAQSRIWLEETNLYEQLLTAR